MTTNLKNIIQADESFLNSHNQIEKGTLISNLQEYQKNINDGLVTIKNDTINLNSDIAKKDSYNYIATFNTILAYRNTIASLQKTLEEQGGDATELLKVKASYDACTAQLEIYKAMANRPAPAPVAPSGGGSSAKEAMLQQQLDKCQLDLGNLQKAKPGILVPAQPVMDEAKKAEITFDICQDFYMKAELTNNLIERRGILIVTKALLDKIRTTYPEPDKVFKSLKQIDQELKKLSNMG